LSGSQRRLMVLRLEMGSTFQERMYFQRRHCPTF
jgi:hypothetical protein